jgi:uncharacterized integral membrane protein
MRSLGTFILGIIVAIAAIVLAVFIVENMRTGTYSFAGNSFSMNEGLLLLLAAVLGFIIAMLLVTPARVGHDRHLGELRRDNTGLAHELTGLRAEHQRLMDEHQQLQAEHDNLTAERDGLRSERDTLRARLASVRETAATDGARPASAAAPVAPATEPDMAPSPARTDTAMPAGRYDPNAAPADGAAVHTPLTDERVVQQEREARQEHEAEQMAADEPATQRDDNVQPEQAAQDERTAQDERAAEQDHYDQGEAQPSLGDRLRGLFHGADAPPPDASSDSTPAPTA